MWESSWSLPNPVEHPGAIQSAQTWSQVRTASGTAESEAVKVGYGLFLWSVWDLIYHSTMAFSSTLKKNSVDPVVSVNSFVQNTWWFED